MRFAQRLALSLRMAVVIVASQITGCEAFSQATPLPIAKAESGQLPRFDIISVRETHGLIMRESTPADGYVGEGVFLSYLIVGAYNVPVFDRIVGLPSWYRDKRFDIRAKVDPTDIPVLQKLSYREHRTMLRQILEERFQLKMHEEEQVRPIYVLTSTGKPGPLLERSPIPDPTSGGPVAASRRISRSRRGQLTLERFTMANFADLLSSSLHVDVIDNTHLDGLYNLQLDWNPDDAAGGQGESSAINAADPAADKPSIFTAVREQLGLKLSASKGPVKVWVIDHVELPSEN